METYTAIFMAVTAATLIRCDWIEIPQTIVSDSEKLTKKTDITMYILTTTSTTTQTPVFAKPTANKKGSITKINTKVNSSRTSTTTVIPAFAKPAVIGKKLTNANSTKRSNTNTRSTLQPPIFGLMSATSRKPPTTPNNKEKSITGNISKIANHVHNNTVKIVPRANNKTAQIVNMNDRNKRPNITARNVTNNKNNINLDETDGEYNEFDGKSSKSKEEDGYSYTSFIPYLSAIQSTLMKNAHKNKRSKLSVLTNLRDHLLMEIENRISTLWSSKTEGRGAREYKEDSHVDFPSNEGALMTIGFLTFAVFLIKLVLQLVQTLSSKMDNGDGTTTTTIIGRKRRGIGDEEAVKILNYIEQYQFK